MRYSIPFPASLARRLRYSSKCMSAIVTRTALAVRTITTKGVSR